MKRAISLGFAVALISTATLGQKKNGPTQARAMIETYGAKSHRSARSSAR